MPKADRYEFWVLLYLCGFFGVFCKVKSNEIFTQCLTRLPSCPSAAFRPTVPLSHQHFSLVREGLIICVSFPTCGAAAGDTLPQLKGGAEPTPLTSICREEFSWQPQWFYWALAELCLLGWDSLLWPSASLQPLSQWQCFKAILISDMLKFGVAQVVPA